MRAQGTVLDAVGRAKHALIGARDAGGASVTVHGECPVASCRSMNVVDVTAGTSSVTCAGCGAVFDV